MAARTARNVAAQIRFPEKTRLEQPRVDDVKDPGNRCRRWMPALSEELRFSERALFSRLSSGTNLYPGHRYLHAYKGSRSMPWRSREIRIDTRGESSRSRSPIEIRARIEESWRFSRHRARDRLPSGWHSSMSHANALRPKRNGPAIDLSFRPIVDFNLRTRENRFTVSSRVGKVCEEQTTDDEIH